MCDSQYVYNRYRIIEMVTRHWLNGRTCF
jgi:hypothetical protein